VKDQLIIKFVTGATENQKKELRADLNSVTLRKFSIIDAELIQLSGMSVEQAIGLFKDDPRIVYVEPNYIWRANIIPNDPDFELLWGMHNTGQTGGTVDADIDAVDAWNIGIGDSIIIGVIDTGLDTAHVDLQNNIWTNPGEIPYNGVDDDSNGYVDDVYGWDFINWDNDPSDDNGHGTHCSGTIAAAGNNAIGVAGVCWSAKIMALKFLGSNGEGTTEDAVLAVEYATQMGARLTSNSWGGGGYSQALKDAIDSSAVQGMLFVASAGNAWNNNDLYPFYPSSYDLDNIISVGATDHYDSLANESTWGSNYGLTSVDLAAPGVNIYSTTPGNGYGYKSGTSMAAPHVSGTVALLWSEHPDLTYLQVKNRIMSKVDTLPNLMDKCVTSGRLNTFMTLAEPDSIPPYLISDLAVINTEATRITLSWTATGDDLSTGRASYYDVRYSFSPIDIDNFNSAYEAFGEPNPQPAGSTETFVVIDLNFDTTYYFAIKAYDEWNNPSGVSNSPWGRTLGPPEIEITPVSLSDSLYINGNSTQALNVSNLEQGELFYEIDVEYPNTREAYGSIIIPPPISILSGEASSGNQDINYAEEIEFDITGEKVTVATRDVLLVYADVGASALRNILESYPDIGLVDLWYAGSLGGSIPLLSDLEVYDCVVAWNNQAWADMYAIGDVLADYIDQGGVVVTMVDCWSAGTYASRGRYFEEKGYSPLKSLGEALFEPRILGWYDPSHPVMDGVNSLDISSYYNNAALTDGAPEVARWDDGTPLVAVNPHTVAINVWPGDGYYWSGDFPTLVHNAINYVASGAFWLSVHPDSGEVAPFSDSSLNVKFDALNLTGGDYEATILVQTNDPDEDSISLPVYLHVVNAPDITVEFDSMDFGIVYIGYPETLLIPISNQGTEVLSVSEILSEETEFSVDITEFVLSPDEDTVVNVTFKPTLLGELLSNLIISSDDPDESTLTVALRGEGLSCPDIWVDSDSVLDSLFIGGVYVETLTIGNSGESPLYFEVELTNFLESFPLSAGNQNKAFSAEQDSYSMKEFLDFGVKKKAVYDPDAKTSSGIYETPLHDLLNIQAAPGNVITSWPAPGLIEHPWGLGFDGINVWVSDLEGVTDSEVDTSGNMLSTFSCSDWAGAWPADMTWDGQYIWQVNVGGDNGIYQLDPASGEVLNSIHDPARKWDSISQRGLAYDRRKDVFYIGGWNQDRVYKIKGLSWDNPGEILNSFYFPAVSGLAWHPQGTLWIAVNTGANYIYQVNPETGEVLNQFVAPGDGSGYEGAGLAMDRWGNLWCLSQVTHKVYLVESGIPAYPWLDVTPWSCTLEVGETKELIVGYDSFGLLGGNYSADIVISSNDCDQPSLIIPAFFHLIGFPDIVLSEDTLDYDTIFVEFSRTDTLVISNQGTDLLKIFDIYSDNSDYTVDTTNFNLSPGDSQEVLITFAPTTEGEISGTLTIESNDSTGPVVTVPLLGQGLFVPDIAVYPDLLSHDLLTGETLTQVLTISNDGLSDLIFSISIKPSSPELNLIKIMSNQNELSFDQGEKPGVALSFLTSEIIDNTGFWGSWEPRSPLSRPRAQHGLVAHPNGKIYAFGGYSGGSTKFLSMVIYDPETDSWSFGAYMPEADRGMATAIDNNGYIYSFTATQGSSFRYDPVSDEWTTISSPPAVQVWEAGAAKGLDGRIYLIGGYGSFNLVQIYDPNTDTWIMGCPMPTPRYQMGVVAGPGALMYTIGGISSVTGSPSSAVEVYDPFADTWFSAAPMPTPRNQFAISLGADGKIYTIGGKSNPADNHTPFYSIVEVYDPETDTWETGPTMPMARGEMEAALCGNGIYVIGGTVGSYLATNEVLYTYGWLSSYPISGTIPAGSSMNIEITYDAWRMTEGEYSAEVVISSNDPYKPEVSVPAQLNVTSAPDITFSQNTLDFGEIYLGTSVIDTLILLNEGLDLLTVTDISSDNSDYTPDTNSFDLDPGKSQKVLINFTPNTTGAVTGNLTISNNDPDESLVMISLLGEGKEPPDISVHPDFLIDSLLTDSTSIQVLTISNQGIGDLVFKISNEKSETQNPLRIHSTNLSRDNTASGTIVKSDKVFPSTNTPLHISKGFGYISPEEVPNEKNIVVSSKAALFAIDTYNDNIVELDPTNGEIINNFPFPDEGSVSGIEGLAFDGTYLYFISFDGSNTIYQLDRSTGEVIVNKAVPGLGYVEGLGHSGDAIYALKSPYTICKIEFEMASIVDQFEFEIYMAGGFTFGGDRGTIFVSAYNPDLVYEIDPSNWEIKNSFPRPCNGLSGLGYSEELKLLFASSGFDRKIYAVNPDNGTIVYSFSGSWVSAIAADEAALVSWLSAEPDSGTIPSDWSTDIQIAFDASGMNGGDYQANIIISNNDPQIPEVKIPAALQVTGIPDITILEDSLNYGSVFVGACVIDTLTISNNGNGVLTVADVSCDNPDYTVDTASFAVSPWQHRNVLIGFTPSATGQIAGTLTIISNDPDDSILTVALKGEGILAPDIDVYPDSLAQELLADDTSTQLLTISNNGENDLDFWIVVKGKGDDSALARIHSQKLLRDSDMGIVHKTFKPKARHELEYPKAMIPDSEGKGKITSVDSFELAGTYSGDHLCFGITDLGCIVPFQYPIGNHNLSASAYTVAYRSGDTDNVKWAYSWGSVGILPLYYAELVVDSSRLIVQVKTRTTDDLLGITQTFGFNRDDKYIQIQTKIENLSESQLDDVVFKSFADLDVDECYENDWNYDFTHNMVYACEFSYAALASKEVSDFMDLWGWGDPEERTTLVEFDTGPVLDINGAGVLHFELGNLFVGSSVNITTIFGAGNSLTDLQEVIDRGHEFRYWLSIDPVFGCIAPDSNMSVYTSFDSRDMKVGDYYADIVVLSTDPDESEISIPIHLAVKGRGDVNADFDVTIADVVYLINYLFKSGPPPEPLLTGDVNCDEEIDIVDAVYIVNYLFKGGPPPC
jgi:subtilisin family serine protease/glutamine cyclotransferase